MLLFLLSWNPVARNMENTAMDRCPFHAFCLGMYELNAKQSVCSGHSVLNYVGNSTRTINSTGAVLKSLHRRDLWLWRPP